MINCTKAPWQTPTLEVMEISAILGFLKLVAMKKLVNAKHLLSNKLAVSFLGQFDLDKHNPKYLDQFWDVNPYAINVRKIGMWGWKRFFSTQVAGSRRSK